MNFIIRRAVGAVAALLDKNVIIALTPPVWADIIGEKRRTRYAPRCHHRRKTACRQGHLQVGFSRARSRPRTPLEALWRHEAAQGRACKTALAGLVAAWPPGAASAATFT